MKHTVKRTTAAILAALILAGTTAAAATFAAPTIAHATEGAGTGTVKDYGFCGDESVNSGKDVQWTLTTNSKDSTKYTLTISGSGAMADYISPQGVPWYNYRPQITSVVIENGVTSIGNIAFYGYSNLESVNISASVTSIGVAAFYGCKSLTSITIPEKVTSIGDAAFLNCTSLTSVTIPGKVTSIGRGAFESCTDLTTVTMKSTTPPTLKSIVFVYTSLNTILVPVDALNNYKNADAEKGWDEYKAILAVGGDCGAEDNTGGVESVKWAFNPATGKLTISGSGKMAYNVSPEDVPWYNYRPQITSVVIENGVTSIGNAVFYDYSNLESVNISASVTSIGDTAFYGCKSLTSITIPSGVINIGSSAFYNCTDLTIVTMEGETPPTLESIVFENTSLNTILVPATALSAYQDACDKSEKGWKGEYKDKLAVGGYCGASTNEGGVESVKWVFNPATGTLTISGKGKMADYSYDSMPWYAYKDQIKSVEIGEDITVIGDYAFSGCEKLTSITIPSSVQTIGSYAFNSCISLESITIPENVTSIGNSAFTNCYKFTSIAIPSNVTSIGNSAFSGCIGLNSIEISNGVKTISDSAFTNCTNLKKVTFADDSQLQSIGNLVFNHCLHLNEINIPKDVTSIGEQAFEKCTDLKEIILPEGLTEIQYNAFYGSGLTEITIPKNVGFIAMGAFAGCKNLASVTIEREEPCTVGTSIFGYENPESLDTRSKFVEENAKGITVPYGSLKAYQTTGYWAIYKDYMEEAPKPNPPAPSVPSQTTTQKPTATDEDGNTVTGTTVTHPDGSVTDTTIVTKPNGDTTTTIVEKDPQGNTTKTTETKVETAADGTKTETETVTEAGKAPVITKTVTKKDGSQTIEKITSAENSRGNTVTTTETTVKDSKGNVVKKTTKKEIKNIGNGTSAVIDVDNNTALINKIGAAKPKGMQATINNKVLSQLKEANNGKNLLLTMIVKDKNGNKRYSVEVNTADLTPKNKLYIYKKDSKTGELLLVNNKAYITDSKGQLKLIIRSKGNFVLKNAEDAAKINEKILSTVQAKKNKVTLAKGKTEPFAFHEDLDMRNVKSISYETSDPRIATVNETGKIKGKKAGTTTITAIVTLKNGETKTVTMKVTVK